MTILIGKDAPDFIAPTLLPDNTIENGFSLKSYIHNHIAVLFFYPLDFTFVCPTEIVALNKARERFSNAKLLLISVDSVYTHLAYKNTSPKHGGIGNISIPMVSDITKEISSSYGVLNSGGVAFRAVFIVDSTGVIRHMLINDLAIGRSIDEIVRTKEAIEHFSHEGEVCPANWHRGSKALRPNIEEVSRYFGDVV